MFHPELFQILNCRISIPSNPTESLPIQSYSHALRSEQRQINGERKNPLVHQFRIEEEGNLAGTTDGNMK